MLRNVKMYVLLEIVDVVLLSSYNGNVNYNSNRMFF